MSNRKPIGKRMLSALVAVVTVLGLGCIGRAPGEGNAWFTPVEAADSTAPVKLNASYGSLNYTNGDKYEGWYVNKKPYGYGTMKYKDGSAARGMWVDGKLQGVGLKIADTTVQIGTFSKGIAQGEYLKVVAPNYKEYVAGHMKNGNFHGNAIQLASESRKSTVQFTCQNGEVKDNTLVSMGNTMGSLTYKNGDTFTGWYKDKKPHGLGLWKYKDGSMYEGLTANGKWDGMGIFSLAINGSYYEGCFSSGKASGYGNLVFADGSFYCGLWFNGYANGEGYIGIPGEGLYKVHYHNGVLQPIDYRTVREEERIQVVQYTTQIQQNQTSKSESTTKKNITQTFVAGTKGFVSSEGPKYLVDGNANTKWCVVNYDENEGYAYVIWKLSEAVVPDGYTLVTANDHSAYPGRNPKTFALYGCNASSAPGVNDKKWVLLDLAVEKLSDENFREYHFDIDAGNRYNYYQFRVVETNGSDTLQIAELGITFDGNEYTYLPGSNEGISSGNAGGGDFFGGGLSSSRRDNDFCNVCRNTGRRKCLTCGGKGYVKNSGSTPNYSGRPGGGGSYSETKSCPNIMCNGGWVDCSSCSN